MKSSDKDSLSKFDKTFVDALEESLMEIPSDVSLMDKAKEVSRALLEFERTAFKFGEKSPNKELAKAKEIVIAAERIVKDGGLDRALLRHLLDEVIHWPSWSKSESFENYKNFSCDLVLAERNPIGDSNRKQEETVISFIYNARTYTLKFLDKGWSAAPDSTEKYGEISLSDATECVLSMNCVRDGAQEFSFWRFLSLKALRLKQIWTLDLLQIATDIQLSRQRKSKDFDNKRILEAAKNIEF